MIVELPFAYTARYVPPRARNLREVTVLDRLPLRIRELAPADFPVVARFADAATLWRWKQVDELRWDGRRFHRPHACEWADRRFHVPSSEFLERIEGHEGEQPFRDLQRIPDPRWDGRDVHRHADVIAARRVEADDRRERVALLVEKAAGVVLCGGRIYEACGEPAWRIRQTDRIVAHAVLADAAALAERPDELARADRLPEYAELFWNRPDLERMGRIDVLMPEALLLAPEAGHLLRVAAGAVDAMGGRLRQASREDFAVYADLRDALAAAPEGEVTEDIAAAARVALEWPGDILSAETRRDLGLAHERWRRDLLRDVGAGMDVPEADRPPADGLAVL